jgi:hypothetical protein
MRLVQLTAAALAAGLALAVAPAASAAPTRPTTLVAIRAAHHPGYDRVVFEFSGPLPADNTVTSVPSVVGDPSGLPVPVAGDAFLRLRMSPAAGHDDNGNGAYGPTRRTYALPEVIQVVSAGDFEGVLSFGIGLARTASTVRLFTLTGPSRVVLDIGADFATVDVRDYFYDVNRAPYLFAVTRPVIPPATARGALQRLFAGPTETEAASGLRFVSSDATGFDRLSIADRVATVRLLGGCASHGSTYTVAGEIMATLRQFPSVGWVKILDPAGNTERPAGHVDSIPTCLEP